jgi:hypothetical protein
MNDAIEEHLISQEPMPLKRSTREQKILYLMIM